MVSGGKVIALIFVWFYCFKFDILGNHAAVRNLMNACNFITVFLHTLVYRTPDFIDIDLILSNIHTTSNISPVGL